MSLELGGRHLFTRKEPVLYTFPLPTVLHDLLDKGVKQGHGNLQLVPSPSNHHWGGGGAESRLWKRAGDLPAGVLGLVDQLHLVCSISP